MLFTTFAFAAILSFPFTAVITLRPGDFMISRSFTPVWTLLQHRRENPEWDKAENTGVDVRILRLMLTSSGIIAGLLFAGKPGLHRPQRRSEATVACLGFIFLGNSLAGILFLVIQPFAMLTLVVASVVLLVSLYLMWQTVTRLQRYATVSVAE